MKKQFRLEYILFKESDEFDRVFYNFLLNDDYDKHKPYSTLVIGPNGTGKSRLLKALIEIFNDLYNHKTNSEATKSHYTYDLAYSIGGKSIVVTYDGFGYLLNINGDFVDFSHIELPDKGIAAAYSLYEKFTPKNSSKIDGRGGRYDNEFYEYLGVKTNNNYAFSSTNITNSIDLITEAVSVNGFDKDLFEVFKVLGFNPTLKIEYEVKKFKRLFSGNIDVSELRNRLSDFNFRNSGFSYSSIVKLLELNDNELYPVVESINFISKYLYKNRKFVFEVIFDGSANYLEYNDFYKHLSQLRRVKFLSYGKIGVSKRNNQVFKGDDPELNSMSSGEIHLLTSFLSLASVVKDSSLILIDEPEISLHPNWQIRYMDLLNTIFRHSSGCHFIIATHSHFLASDLLPDASAILSLRADREGKIIPETIPSAYGLSAENVLYNIFGVVTTRNLSFELDVKELLRLVRAESKDYDAMRTLVNKFRKFQLSTADPLLVLIKDVEKYLQNS
ncbi:AAA family ATPase [Hymenobacter humi]|uniref:AAA family ATPase n=1 Tax=Hymenobacter humi TaxID=1411620 RepID=A0ABW2U6B7_9BACT